MCKGNLVPLHQTKAFNCPTCLVMIPVFYYFYNITVCCHFMEVIEWKSCCMLQATNPKAFCIDFCCIWRHGLGDLTCLSSSDHRMVWVEKDLEDHPAPRQLFKCVKNRAHRSSTHHLIPLPLDSAKASSTNNLKNKRKP